MRHTQARETWEPTDLGLARQIDPDTLRRRDLKSDLEAQRTRLTADLARVNGMLEELARHG